MDTVTRTATLRDVIDVLKANHLVVDEPSSYGPKVGLTKVGKDLLMTVGETTEGILDNVLVEGLLVAENPVTGERQ